MVLVLTVAAGLSSYELLEAAEAQPFGQTRSVLIEVSDFVDDLASTVYLDRPNLALRQVMGRPVERTVPGGGNELAASPRLASPAAQATTEDASGIDPLGPRLPAPGSEATSSGPNGPNSAGSDSAGSGATGLDEASAITPEVSEEPVARIVSPEMRLRLWAGGDSLGEYVGNQLLQPVGDADYVDVRLDYHISTGLARPDYFDWNERIRQVMAQEQPPEVLVFMVGGNDNQNMLHDGRVLQAGSHDWYREYERRVATILDEIGDAHLYWIGLPPMRDEHRHRIAMEVNEILRRNAETRPQVSYVDIDPMFSGPQDAYSPQIVDPAGQVRLARASDGVHITFVGSTWVAEVVWQLVTDRWTFQAVNEDWPQMDLHPLHQPL